MSFTWCSNRMPPFNVKAFKLPTQPVWFILLSNQPLATSPFVSIVCGGHLQATTGVKHFYSHAKYGDHNYENKEDCDWIIEAPAGKNVHLTFLTFELEDEHECGYDSIEVYQGFDDSGPTNGRYCGNRVIKIFRRSKLPLRISRWNSCVSVFQEDNRGSLWTPLSFFSEP